jgi:hypothetical protein
MFSIILCGVLDLVRFGTLGFRNLKRKPKEQEQTVTIFTSVRNPVVGATVSAETARKTPQNSVLLLFGSISRAVWWSEPRPVGELVSNRSKKAPVVAGR